MGRLESSTVANQYGCINIYIYNINPQTCQCEHEHCSGAFLSSQVACFDSRDSKDTCSMISRLDLTLELKKSNFHHQIYAIHFVDDYSVFLCHFTGVCQDPVHYLPPFEEGLLGFLADTAPKVCHVQRGPLVLREKSM